MTGASEFSSTATLLRYRYRLRGQLQGVGFRPFVHGLARRHFLTGWVRNDAAGVCLEVQGTAEDLEGFDQELMGGLPRLARVEQRERSRRRAENSETAFVIERSEKGASAVARAGVTIDAAVCADCLAEMLDPGDRRYRYPFTNCTNCGPRYSIIRDVPYDRENTTMAAFGMCGACREEYEEAGSRRFHAQPNCCPRCGPRLELVTAEGKRVAGDAVEITAELLLSGKIVAIKGLGGFHLAVRADAGAWGDGVSRLRGLKRRERKPFAVMVPDVERARELVEISEAGVRAVESVHGPIVLAPRRAGSGREVVEAVAPGTHLLGVMVPYTPLHHLLFRAMAERGGRAPVLVMTSGNLSEEPLVTGNAEAVKRLGGAGLCDAILLHDREIERAVDDSVVRDVGSGGGVMIRRSRGYAPSGWSIPERYGAHGTGICVGGDLKNTVAVVRGQDVILSQHLGDLGNVRAYEHFQRAIEDLVRLFDVKVEFVAHDLHPQFLSVQWARELGKKYGARLVPVQHHVAHAFGALAEHGVSGAAVAVVCDGTGYGVDGTTWGGEVFRVEGHAWERVGHLQPMRLAGGDAAARDPRRSALSLLQVAYGEAFGRVVAARELFENETELRTFVRMIGTGWNSPWTTSAGRLFDGVAALLGICSCNGHEAEAPMALEAAAYRAGREAGRDEGASWWRVEGETPTLSLAPFVRHAVEEGGGREVLAAEFHASLAEGLVEMMRRAGGEQLPVVISGGVFCNQMLMEEVVSRGRKRGMRVLVPQVYPPTDAGLAFGQAAFVLAEGGR